MSSALPIGHFQFDNLLKSRVPFYLLRYQVDVESAYGVMEKMHLRTYSLELPTMTLVDAENALKERQARLQDPVVILDEKGEESRRLANEMAKAGYMNVCFVVGGWQALQEEMRAEQG